MYFFIGTVLLSYTYPFNALCKVKLWLLDLERDFFPKQIYSTSRPKARDGHRYPCPALAFCNGSSYVSRAAALEGTGGDKVL